jgi:hypothetical protein
LHVLLERRQHRKTACSSSSSSKICLGDADLDEIGGGGLQDNFYDNFHAGEELGGAGDIVAVEFFR